MSGGVKVKRLALVLASSFIASGAACACRQATTSSSEPAKRTPLTAAEVRDQFERQMTQRGFTLAPVDAGLYRVTSDGGPALQAYIGNLQRNAVRDDDPSQISHFVSQIASLNRGTPWNEARDQLFLKLEPNGYDFDGMGAIHWPISARVDGLLTLVKPGSSQLRWVTKEMLGGWGVTSEDARRIAEENMGRLLSRTPIEVDEVDGHKLGLVMLEAPLKASIILAPNLRETVEEKLGWPVLAVTPCRDFIYLHDDDEEFARRGASVVVEEFQTSGYPITTELWRISDAGLEVLGAFAPAPPVKRKIRP